MLELLKWLDLDSVRKVAELSANSLILLYFITYVLSKRAAFLVAFLITELYGLSTISDSLNEVNFYLGYALIYCLLYCYLLLKQDRKRTLAAVVLIILLDAGSAIDAYAYREIETAFYNSYEYLFAFVHLCLLGSLINWRILRTIMGQAFNAVLGFFGASYSYSFFLYNIKNTFNTK